MKKDSHTLGDRCHFRWQVVLYRCSTFIKVCDFLRIFKNKKDMLVFFLQGYFYNDDTFNFNYAQAKAALGNYKEAEEVPHFIYTTFFERLLLGLTSYLTNKIFFFQFFLLIQSEKIKNDYIYLSWLARCCMYSSLTDDIFLQNFYVRLFYTCSTIHIHNV